jgi:hypothetical protein
MEDLFAALEPYYCIHGSTRANELPNPAGSSLCYFVVAGGGIAGSTEASATLPFCASASET